MSPRLPVKEAKRGGMHHRGRVTLAAIALLLVLLLLPLGALAKLAQHFDGRVVFGCAAMLSVVTFLLYRDDKRLAQKGGWRTPEATLHSLELLGGWPGAFLAQRLMRHKTAKTRYQVVFWVIVVLHELASCDSLLEWKYSKRAFGLLFG